MKANMHTIQIDESTSIKGSQKIEKRRIRRQMKKVCKSISKHVTIDKDGIFKDPDWPHLWDHKR